MRRWSVVCAVVAALSSAASARAEGFEDFEGKSVIYTYRERVTFPDGQAADNTWAGTVYVARSGQVFFRHHGFSHFGNNGSQFQESRFDTEGDRNGVGSGNRTNYHWDGNGFSRSWAERGTTITQGITVAGNRCRSFIERAPFAGQAGVLSESCRVVSGNALGR